MATSRLYSVRVVSPGTARCRGQLEPDLGGKREWTWGETEMARPAQGTGVPSHASASLANGAVRAGGGSRAGWEALWAGAGRKRRGSEFRRPEKVVPGPGTRIRG